MIDGRSPCCAQPRLLRGLNWDFGPSSRVFVPRSDLSVRESPQIEESAREVYLWFTPANKTQIKLLLRSETFFSVRRCNYLFKSPHNFLAMPGSVSFRIMDGGAGWVQLFHHEEVRQLVKSKKVQVVTLPLMRRHMFAVHFLLHKSSILAL